jgi:predicted NBD/HSP70 family sugar kinase
MPLPTHGAYDALLKDMEAASGVSRNVLARVLVRVMISAPHKVARADIAKGTMLSKPSQLNQSAVSRAVDVLVQQGFVTQFDMQPDLGRAGRPIKPLRLGSSGRALMGIKIVHRLDRPVKLFGVLSDMRVEDGSGLLAELEQALPQCATFDSLPDHIRRLHDALMARAPEQPRLLGIGIELASHVHEGNIIGATHVGLASGETFDLLTPLQQVFGGETPIVIDNDVNVLAVRETYRALAERHVALVAVLEDGVGASLIVDGHVYRGGGGMAAEPGHQTVVDLPELQSLETGTAFGDPCHCGRPGHVDCYSTPKRMETALGTTLAQAGRAPAVDAKGDRTREAEIFRVGGLALGQGIASIVNVVNPARVLLVLPGDLAMDDRRTQHISDAEGPGHAGRARRGTAAAAYLEAVEEALSTYSFSLGASDARAGEGRLRVQVLDTHETEQQGAICAAIRVLDAFVMHARERDRCHELARDGTTPLAVESATAPRSSSSPREDRVAG